MGCVSFIATFVFLCIIFIIIDTIKDTNTSVEGEVVSSVDNNKLGQWTIEEYVNDFKEPTGEKYVFQKTTNGLFSNSATTDSELTAEILINKKNICLRLKEYGRYYVKDEPEISFYVKGKDGVKTISWNYCDSQGYISLNDKNTNIVMKVLLQGGEIKFHGWDKGVRSTYNFSFNGDKLKEALAEIGVYIDPNNDK